MKIVIGLGTGRCGTKSLHALLNAQENSVCFHEANPACMSWQGAEHVVLSMLRNFNDTLLGEERKVEVDLTSCDKKLVIKRYLTLDKVEVVGDVASYYLPYVDMILERYNNVVFPCMVRDKKDVIKSFMRKVRLYGYRNVVKCIILKKKRSRNHWSDNDKYVEDIKWDKLHPSFGVDLELEEALSRYYDLYMDNLTSLASRYKEVKVFGIDELNSPEGRKSILDFCGVERVNVNSIFHENSDHKVF